MYRQWCRLLKNVKAARQMGHCLAAASGCHTGTGPISAPPLVEALRDEYDGECSAGWRTRDGFEATRREEGGGGNSGSGLA